LVGRQGSDEADNEELRGRKIERKKAVFTSSRPKTPRERKIRRGKKKGRFKWEYELKKGSLRDDNEKTTT